MTSKNAFKELISLLQYMKNTSLDNPDIEVQDERIIELDRIVAEVKESEEWEEIQMNILEIGISKGIEQGIEQGESRKLVLQVCRKLAKGYQAEDIAEMLEEEPERIREICEIAADYAPEYVGEQVWEAYCQKKYK